MWPEWVSDPGPIKKKKKKKKNKKKKTFTYTAEPGKRQKIAQYKDV